MSFIRSFFILLFLCIALAGSAQDKKFTPASETQLALKYYRNGEYEKAAEIYQRLYFTNRSYSYYRYFMNSLIKLEKYDRAEELAKEQVKTYKNNLNYLVDLGYVYTLQGNLSKAKSVYNSAIRKLGPDQHRIMQLANAFMAKRLYEYAEETYLEGRKLMKGKYGFNIEMAQLYYYQRAYQKMIDEYLDILKVSRQYLQHVQNRLQNAVYNDIDDSLRELLKSSLLERINEYPEITVYNELLIWLYIQDENFKGAFLQAQALDRRFNENGSRIVSLARIAAQNQNFQVAIDAYQYVINKGKHLEYFFEARNEMLQVMFKRIKLGLDTRVEDYKRLEESYTDALQDMGTNSETVEMVKNLAHLKAFYLGKTAEAQLLLEEALSIRGLNLMERGELELELADVYLVDGKVWDATFAYARVEENNKNNPVGSEAKFRKARLAYFIGNFEWSRAQLDVLKASTSKFIANDAADLAFFIFENTGWDTVETAMEIYSRADFLRYQSKDSLAVLTLDSLTNQFPQHAIADEAWYLKAKLYKRMQKFQKAEAAYLYVIDNFYTDVLADNSMYALAQMYEYDFESKEMAMELYKRILTDFRGSIYTVDARKRFRQLRGDEAVN